MFNDGNSTVSCIVRELSATGARISLASTSGIPALFTLKMPGGANVLCRLIWVSPTEMGVAFIDSPVEVTFAEV